MVSFNAIIVSGGHKMSGYSYNPDQLL